MCAALIRLFTFGCKSTQNAQRTSTAAEKAAIRSESQLVDLLSPRFTRKEGKPFNILVLSGGAAHGAWATYPCSESLEPPQGIFGGTPPQDYGGGYL